MVPLNSASGGFACIWQSKKGGIIAINNEGTQIHFLSDVLVIAASLDLKVPIAGAERGRTRSGYRILQKLKASMLLLSFVACDGRLHLHFMKIIGPLMISWFLDIGIQRVLGTKDDSTAAACLQSLLSLARFWRTRERLCMTRVTSLLSMRCMLLWHNFESRPNSPESGLSYDRRFITKRMLALEKPFWREKTRLTSQRSLDCSGFKAWSDSGSLVFSRNQNQALLAGRYV